MRAADYERIYRAEAEKNRRGNGGELGAHWKNACQKSPSTGAPIANLWNALLALRNDPAWIGKLRYDQMLQTQIGPDGPIQDTDLIPIHEWLQANGLNRIGLDTTREAVEGVCLENPFHPLRDELQRLGREWDEVARLSNWPVTYLGSQSGEPIHTIGVMFLIAMVARVFEPGCKADYMPVLEGPQGNKKSQACEILAGPYFSDTLPDLASDPVRVSMHLRGKWLIEVAELSSFSRPDAARLKSFLSTRVEQYTPKFAHNEVRQPRQCLFVGTTNEDSYLRDPTGGRRFWPIKCGNINLDALLRDRNLLIGEAVEQYRLGRAWWPEPDFEDRFLKPLQETRYEADPWDNPIADKLAGRSRVTTFEVARDLLNIPESQIGTVTTRRVAAILRNLGWIQNRIGKQRFWSLPL